MYGRLPIVNVTHGRCLDMKWGKPVFGAFAKHLFHVCWVGVLMAHDFNGYLHYLD